MFPAARLKYLEARKSELVAAIGAQRGLLTAECATLRRRLEWVDQTISITRRLLSFAALACPLWSFWTARRPVRDGSWLNGMLSLLPVVQRMARFILPPITRKDSYD